MKAHANLDLITPNSADTTLGPDLTGPEMVAAVSNAGGLGILQAQFCAPPLFRKEIHRIRALTADSAALNGVSRPHGDHTSPSACDGRVTA